MRVSRSSAYKNSPPRRRDAENKPYLETGLGRRFHISSAAPAAALREIVFPRRIGVSAVNSIFH